MTDDLRTQVARRLAAHWFLMEEPDMDLAETLETVEVTEPWLAVADECIRIAEWAHTVGLERGGHHTGDDAARKAAEDPDMPLTLPPDSWRPE